MEQLDLNVRALVHAFTPDMVGAKPGGVINIASTLLFSRWPGPTFMPRPRHLYFCSAKVSRHKRGKTAWLPAVSYKGMAILRLPVRILDPKEGVSAWSQ
jgi:hypothetical protein